MIAQSKFSLLTPKTPNKLNGSQLSLPKTQVTQPSDWTSLLGLLILTGLTGLSAFVMIVDMAALRQAFQPNLVTPSHHKIEISDTTNEFETGDTALHVYVK